MSPSQSMHNQTRAQARRLPARRWAAAIALLVGLGLWAPAAHAQQKRDFDLMRSVQQANQALAEGQFAAANTLLNEIDAHASTVPPQVYYLRAYHDFYVGDYLSGVQWMDKALGETPGRSTPPAHWTELRALIQSTHEVTKDYQKYTSPKGYFEIFVPPGKDRVLVPFAGEALDRAYDEVGAELGFYPPTPIRMEVYPQTSVLAQVSSLTEDEIRTSGTIALCKYNRLMITSPRALLRGYSWVDTAVHEYVHYVISAKTGDRVPIWMHEGLAKFLERRWRGPHAEQLPPSAEQLLKERVKKNKLITFEQMHPSMAKLPSQDDAAVAFAQVYTVMEYLKWKVGDDAFKNLLDAVNAGMDAKQAYAHTLGEPFSAFEKHWLAYLKTRKSVAMPDENGFEDKLVFRDQKTEESDLNSIEKPLARQYMHLGELMQARDRWAAALVEYEKAAHLLGQKHPLLQTRRAQALLAEKRPEEALAMLKGVHEIYPGFVQIWVEMGRAALALEQYDAARDYLTEAARINPFDPAIHEYLAETYTRQGDAKTAEEFRQFAKLVR